MPNELLIFNLTSGSAARAIFDIPNHCPHCALSIKPVFSQISTFDNLNMSLIGMLLKCPSCNHFFALEYSVERYVPNGNSETKLLQHIYKTIPHYDLPDELALISAAFKEIYTQSLIAESDGLTQICGIGYRKAVEFLIKDFLINFLNEDSEKIAILPLGQAIKMIDSDKVKNLATASSWLGNDETHYTKKYIDKDVSNMKRFIKSLAFFISSEIIAKDAKEFVDK